jgi:hypothetical protein
MWQTVILRIHNVARFLQGRCKLSAYLRHASCYGEPFERGLASRSGVLDRENGAGWRFGSGMESMDWRQVPVGLDAERWVTRTGCKTVLVVVHTVTTGQRLAAALRLIESDLRVQVVFTAAPDVFSNGVTELLRELDGVVIPWEQATRMGFDLALAAAYGELHKLRAPVIVMPHGAGHNKLAVRWHARGDRLVSPPRPGHPRPAVPGGPASGRSHRRSLLRPDGHQPPAAG